MKFTLDHIAVTVRDLRRALEFYSKLLGLQVLKEKTKPELGVSYALLQGGNLTLEVLCPSGDSSPEFREVALRLRRQGLNHLALQVENLEEASSRFREAGMRLVGELKPSKASKIAFLEDGEGNLFELIEKD